MMTPDQLAKLKRSLILDEGYRNFPYKDTNGKITIGIGYNLTDRGLSNEWINENYEKDIKFFIDNLSVQSWWKDLNPDRQIVLINMAYNLGWKNFMSFRKMIKGLEIGDYSKAAQEMLDSKWALQVKGRATILAKAMERGMLDV